MATKEKPITPKPKAEPTVADALIGIGRNLLKDNLKMTAVYMTADGAGFYEENDAQNHARNLTDKTIIPVKKDDK